MMDTNVGNCITGSDERHDSWVHFYLFMIRLMWLRIKAIVVLDEHVSPPGSTPKSIVYFSSRKPARANDEAIRCRKKKRPSLGKRTMIYDDIMSSVVFGIYGCELREPTGNDCYVSTASVCCKNVWLEFHRLFSYTLSGWMSWASRCAWGLRAAQDVLINFKLWAPLRLVPEKLHLKWFGYGRKPFFSLQEFEHFVKIIVPWVFFV